MDDFLKESLDQLAEARKSGRMEDVLEALEDVIAFNEDERANLTYIEEMEKLASSLGNREMYLTALSFRCNAYQELEEWPRLRSAAEEYQREAQGNKGEVSTALLFLAEADLAQGDLERARARLEESAQLGQQSPMGELVDNARASHILSLRQKLARAQGDQPTVDLLEAELEKLQEAGQDILKRQLMGAPPKPAGAGGVLAVLVAIVLGLLLIGLGRS